jgi:high-affinity iron transporter
MLANYLIGLREGLEATLIVSILVAYLVKTGHKNRLGSIWTGVAAAVALSLAFGALLTFTASNLSFEAQERFGGIMSIIAVGFVTWMVFWMRRTARFLKTELQGRLDTALMMGTLALAVTAFIAVAREGLETSLFLWAAAQSAGTGATPLFGASLGILTAVVLGYLLYRRAITINLSRFFTWTGAGLIIVAAGVLAYGVHDLQEAGDLPGLNNLAFDVSGAVPPDSWYGSVLKGVFNFSPATTWLEAIAWLLYVVPVMVLFFRPVRKSAAPAPAPAPATPTATADTADTASVTDTATSSRVS